MDKGIDRIVGIVEDHAIICGFLEELSFYISIMEQGGEVQRPFLPHLNDTDMMDVLSRVAERVINN